jgi:hypothetical protein
MNINQNEKAQADSSCTTSTVTSATPIAPEPATTAATSTATSDPLLAPNGASDGTVTPAPEQPTGVAAASAPKPAKAVCHISIKTETGHVACDLRTVGDPAPPSAADPRKLYRMDLAATTSVIDADLFACLAIQLARAQSKAAASLNIARVVLGIGNLSALHLQSDSVGLYADLLRQPLKDRGLVSDADQTLAHVLDEFLRAEKMDRRISRLISSPEGAPLAELAELVSTLDRASAALDAAMVQRFPEYQLTMFALHANLFVSGIANILTEKKIVGGATPPANQITSPTLRHIQSKTSSASPIECPNTVNGRWRIQKALLDLWNIDDRDGWQADLITALLTQEAGGVDGFDPRQDGRFGKLVAGLAVFFRLFEVRQDQSFRHQPGKFDAEGFLHFTPPWTYADTWLESIPQDMLHQAESFLNAAGILEFKEIRTRGVSVPCIRLRGDLIVEYLKRFNPDKYATLGVTNN